MIIFALSLRDVVKTSSHTRSAFARTCFRFASALSRNSRAFTSSGDGVGGGATGWYRGGEGDGEPESDGDGDKDKSLNFPLLPLARRGSDTM